MTTTCIAYAKQDIAGEYLFDMNNPPTMFKEKKIKKAQGFSS